MGLLQKLTGGDPNERLHDAASTGSVAKVEKLLDGGADVDHRDVRDRSLRTPIQTALMAWGKAESDAEKQRITDTIRLLLKRKADIGMPDAAGRTAKDWASLVGHLKAGVMISRVASGKDPD